jgi:hypothetical protein
MPAIQENGEDNAALVMAPTIANIKKMQTIKKTSNPKVAKTTFSTMVTNPFG